MNYKVSPELCEDMIDLLKDTYCFECLYTFREHIYCKNCFINECISKLEELSP